MRPLVLIVASLLLILIRKMNPPPHEFIDLTESPLPKKELIELSQEVGQPAEPEIIGIARPEEA